MGILSSLISSFLLPFFFFLLFFLSYKMSKRGYQLDPNIEISIREFIFSLRRRQIKGSYEVARLTAELLRRVISSKKWKSTRELILSIKTLGKTLIQANPLELVVGNIVRRVLYIIRESAEEQQRNISPKLDDSLESSPDHKKKSRTPHPMLSERTKSEVSLVNVMDGFRKGELKHSPMKTDICQEILELVEEIKRTHDDIAAQSIDYIQNDEVILTFGLSKSVVSFLSFAAKKKRKFTVIVAESSPSNLGRETAELLAKKNIETVLIPDTAIFSLMSRVNKVIIGTHAVMANGGLLALCGTHMVAQSARFHSVPLLVCVGLYKLTPHYPHDQDTFNDLNSPGEIMSFGEVDYLQSDGVVLVQNPAYDYIPPELINLYITETEVHNPSYIYRLLSECYSTDDYDL